MATISTKFNGTTFEEYLQEFKDDIQNIQNCIEALQKYLTSSSPILTGMFIYKGELGDSEERRAS